MKVNNICNQDLIIQIDELYRKHHTYWIELHTEEGVRPLSQSEIDWQISTMTTEDELHIKVPCDEVIEYNDHTYTGPCMIVYRVFDSH